MKRIFVFLLVLILITAMTVPAFAEDIDAAPAQQLTQSVTGQLIEVAKELISVVVMALAGYVGLCIKRLYRKYVDNDVKAAVVWDAVRFIEQVYKDIHGPDKYNQALLYIESILEEKGIDYSAEEMEAMIEAAVHEMNKAMQPEPSA